MQEDLSTAGRRLFDWLNGRENWLVTKLAEAFGKPVVLAIATAHQLSHLPWEVLHDGAQFLVQRFPAVVPLRWRSSDQVTYLTVTAAPQNRALRVIFMATSPRGVDPVLDYEQEEAQILKATARAGIGLTVEESGCLEELDYLIDSQERGYFDVVHLTGHATLEDGQPRFLTETLTGDPYAASAEEIARAIVPFPPLVFLSGCRTGQAGHAGAVPSMAEQLLDYGAVAVLGWGQNVLDTNATAAAAALYEALSRSNSLVEAVALSYQALIQQEARDWHLLRLYVAKTLPERLVLPERTPGWQRAPRPSMTTEFLDPVTQTIRVPTRESFVGRRRQLQNCLRALTQSRETVGVLIHGMGGLGKSSLAARICDRLPQFQRLVWQGRLDPNNFVTKLSDALDEAALRRRLSSQEEDLRFRLRSTFVALAERRESPFLWVFDDFEVNLTAQGATYRLNSPAREVLQALVWAIQATDVPHRFILTSRYDFENFETSAARLLYKQPLDALQGADLEKKCSRLSAWKRPDLKPDATEAEVAAAGQSLALQEQAKHLADGNPRLLETLNDQVLVKVEIDREAQLQAWEADPTDLRKQVVADQLLRQMQGELRAVLANGLVFELPVPRAALEEVTLIAAFSQSKLESVLIDRAIALGLLEVSPDQTLRVPRILPLSLPETADRLYPKAAQMLYRLWWETDHSISEDQALEMVRLGRLAHNQDIAVGIEDRIATQWVNTSRFREAQQLCQQILQQFEDYRILGTLARAEQVLGDTEDAVAHYEKALSLCPEVDDLRKAATLHNMAGVIAAQGDIERAMQLWQDSLELTERINDVQGKAVTLANMAYVAGESGDKTRQLELNLQSAQALASARAYLDLFTVLTDLGVTAETDSQVYLAQALWLGLRITSPLVDLVNLLRFFFNQVPQGDEMEALLATTALFFCQMRGEGHPQIEELRNTSLTLLATAAAAQGITCENLEELANWMAQQQLNDPQLFIPRLNQQLEAMVGDRWLFDNRWE